MTRFVPSGSLVEANEVDRWMDGAALLERARVEAEATIEHARSEAKAIREEARMEGMRAGAEEEKQQALKWCADLANVVAELADSLPQLTMACLQQVCGRIDAKELTQAVVLQAVAGIRDEKKIVVRVCAKATSDVGEVLGRHLPDDTIFEVRADPDLKHGDCILETPSAFTDGRLHVKLSALRRSLGLDDAEVAEPREGA